MPCGSNSTAHSRVKAFLPPLEAAYADVPPWPVSATLDPILTMEPFVLIKCGRQA